MLDDERMPASLGVEEVGLGREPFSPHAAAV
jgi:hypothetical protein